MCFFVGSPSWGSTTVAERPIGAAASAMPRRDVPPLWCSPGSILIHEARTTTHHRTTWAPKPPSLQQWKRKHLNRLGFSIWQYFSIAYCKRDTTPALMQWSLFCTTPSMYSMERSHRWTFVSRYAPKTPLLLHWKSSIISLQWRMTTFTVDGEIASYSNCTIFLLQCFIL